MTLVEFVIFLSFSRFLKSSVFFLSLLLGRTLLTLTAMFSSVRYASHIFHFGPCGDGIISRGMGLEILIGKRPAFGILSNSQFPAESFLSRRVTEISRFLSGRQDVWFISSLLILISSLIILSYPFDTRLQMEQSETPIILMDYSEPTALYNDIFCV